MTTSANFIEQATFIAGSTPSPKDLVWLVCPVCRSALELVAAQGYTAPKVRCTGCERCYPVVDGLPILLAERATLTSATKV